MRKTAQKYFNTQPNDSPAVKYEAIDESNGVTGLPKKCIVTGCIVKWIETVLLFFQNDSKTDTVINSRNKKMFK